MTIRPLVLLSLLFACALVAQDPPKGTTKDDDDVVKAGPKDPFTEGDPDRMKAVGIQRYGPFPWADHKTTDDIDVELGKGRILWFETAHFRVGINLKTVALPQEQNEKKFLYEELRALHKLLPKIPERPKKLEPWIRLHLYAQRLEKLYADVQSLLHVTDADFGDAKEPPNGKYLGLPDKHLVLLFQKKSDLARYFERFCDFKVDKSMRWYHQQTNQMLAAVCSESLEGYDATAIYGHVVYAVAHNLLNGYRGYHMQLPLWLDEGLAHHFARQVPSGIVNVQVLDSEAEPEDNVDVWPAKVRRRAQHEGVCFTFAQMSAWAKFEELGYHAHSQAWSRVDFLLARDRDKVGVLVDKLKHMPPVDGGMIPPAQVSVQAQKLLFELFELDAASFDEQWRDWVLKTYPKK